MHSKRLWSRARAGALAVVAVVAAAGGSDALRAQEVQTRAPGSQLLARNAQVIVPQSRGFLLDHRGDAVVVEAVRAHVTLRGAAATTVLDVTVRNPGASRAQAVVLLPVPPHAAVTSFAFEGSGAEPSARLLPAAEARRLYDDIVRSSVFPVEAGGRQRVRIAYEHVAPEDGPRIDYVLPRSAALDVRIPWDVTVDVVSDEPVVGAYSPTHAIDSERLFARPGAGRIRVRVAPGARAEPGAFRLSVLRERGGLTASLFAYPDAGGDGGTFLFLGGVPTPAPGSASSPPRQVMIVLDRSGSMAGVKLDQARAATLQVIEGLRDGERFSVIDYATDVARFAPQPVAKSRETIVAVRKYLDGLRPAGGTNLHDALVASVRQPVPDAFLPLILFLTDGLPTVGERSEAAISAVIDAHAQDAQERVPRIFTFGVGNDVNAPLLDRIADCTRAVATYVRPGDDVELAVDRVFRRLAGPVLTTPRVEALGEDGAVSTRRVHDTMPARLPDVFDGDNLVVLGNTAAEAACDCGSPASRAARSARTSSRSILRRPRPPTPSCRDSGLRGALRISPTRSAKPPPSVRGSRRPRNSRTRSSGCPRSRAS